MYLNTRIFPTTGHARVLFFMFIRRELGGTRTGCLFQFTYCVYCSLDIPTCYKQRFSIRVNCTPLNICRLVSDYLHVSAQSED